MFPNTSHRGFVVVVVNVVVDVDVVDVVVCIIGCVVICVVVVVFASFTFSCVAYQTPPPTPAPNLYQCN